VSLFSNTASPPEVFNNLTTFFELLNSILVPAAHLCLNPQIQECILCPWLSEPATFYHTLLMWSLKYLLKPENQELLQFPNIHLQYKMNIMKASTHNTIICRKNCWFILKWKMVGFFYKVFLSMACNKVSVLSLFCSLLSDSLFYPPLLFLFPIHLFSFSSLFTSSLSLLHKMRY